MAASQQESPVVVSDGGGGAIVVWTDRRNETFPASDVYAQRIGPDGAVPTGVGPVSGSPRLVVSPGAPNPFSDVTRFDVLLDEDSDVDVKIYDVRGRLLREQPLGSQSAGLHSIEFDGRDAAGQLLPSGIYFCRVTAVGMSKTLKFVITR